MIHTRVYKDWFYKSQYRFYSFRYFDLWYDVINKKDLLIHEQIKEADEVNKLFTTSSLSTGILSYTTHAQAVYTSRLLDFKNLPEPKNANDNKAEYTGN